MKKFSIQNIKTKNFQMSKLSKRTVALFTPEQKKDYTEFLREQKEEKALKLRCRNFFNHLWVIYRDLVKERFSTPDEYEKIQTQFVDALVVCIQDVKFSMRYWKPENWSSKDVEDFAKKIPYPFFGKGGVQETYKFVEAVVKGKKISY